MTIKENDFRRIDLNLLIAFAVLFREQSVSAAADKLHLGQPAVSGVLSRLRTLFDDPLFIRSGHKMQPTARAQELHTELLPLLEQLQSTLFQQAAFDAQTVNVTLTLGMADWVEIWLMPKLIPALQTAAPGMRLNVVASDPFSDAGRLEGSEMDMAISVAAPGPRWLEREVLTSMSFVTLWHPSQLDLASPLDIDTFATLPHLMVSYREATRSHFDSELEKTGRQRRILYTTPHFAALPGLLETMPALATVPAGLASEWQRTRGLHASPPPLNVEPFEVAMLWHQRHSSDPAVMWLKAFIADLVA